MHHSSLILTSAFNRGCCYKGDCCRRGCRKPDCCCEEHCCRSPGRCCREHCRRRCCRSKEHDTPEGSVSELAQRKTKRYIPWRVFPSHHMGLMHLYQRDTLLMTNAKTSSIITHRPHLHKPSRDGRHLCVEPRQCTKAFHWPYHLWQDSSPKLRRWSRQRMIPSISGLYHQQEPRIPLPELFNVTSEVRKGRIEILGIGIQNFFIFVSKNTTFLETLGCFPQFYQRKEKWIKLLSCVEA